MRVDTPEVAFHIDDPLDVGESPCWDAREQALWFVDILAPAVFRLDATTNAIRRWTMPRAVGSLGLATDGRLAVAGQRTIRRQGVGQSARVTHDVVFCFDGDRAGRDAAWRALENVLPQVRDGRRIGFLFLPDGEDPDSLVQREGATVFAARLDTAQPLTDYLVERLRAQVNVNTDEGAARLMELARPLLERMPDSPARDLLVQALDRGSVLRRHTRLQQAPAGVGEFRRKVDYRKSPVRHAIALLLAEPALAAEAGERSSYARIDAPGVDLLLELIDIFRDSPHLPAGAAVERYRGTARQRPLERLLAWAPEVPANEFDWQQEFRDTLARIRALGDRRRQLMDRLARGERLEAEELDWLRSVPAGNAGSPPQEP